MIKSIHRLTLPGVLPASNPFAGSVTGVLLVLCLCLLLANADAAGTVVAWGSNRYGQTTVPSGLSDLTAIAAGDNHTVALKSDGTVVAWGNNNNGQTTVPVGLSGVTAIAAVNAALQAAAPVVSNVRAAQRLGAQLVDIYYDLADADSATLTVSVAVSTNAGASYSVAASSFTGALDGSVTPGSNKQITWNTGTDLPAKLFSNVRVQVTATDLPTEPSGMALIPAGSFQMGDTFIENDSGGERPVHSVFVSAFYMDKYEVTKTLWNTVKEWSRGNGYGFEDASFGTSGSGMQPANHPVQDMIWYDVVKWCNARSQKEGRVPAYYANAALTQVYKTGQLAPYVKWVAGYRLPTEAEWEKAARGGASGHRFPWSDSDTITHSRANYRSVSSYPYDVSPTRGYHPKYFVNTLPVGVSTSPVGSFAANGYGLYDMAGNVWELCWDWYGGYPNGAQTDPRGPASGSTRVARGGSWRDYAISCRLARRAGDYPQGQIFRYGDIGFRSVLPPGQPTQGGSSTAISPIFTVDSRSAPPVAPTLNGVTITGNSQILSGQSLGFQAVAHFADGSSSNISAYATWSVLGAKPEGTGFLGNLLNAGQTLSRTTVQIRAEYADMTGKRTSEPFTVTIDPAAFKVTFSKEESYSASPSPIYNVTFRGNSSGPNGPAVSYSWDLNGDGVFGDAAGQAVSRTYTPGQTILIGVRGTDSSGATASSRFYVTLEKRGDPATSQEPDKLIPAPDPVSGRLLDSSGKGFAFESAKINNGLVIITHGLWSSSEFEWLGDMAEAITNRLGVIENKPVPNVCVYDWADRADPNHLTKEGTDISAWLLYAASFVDDRIIDLWKIRPYALAQGVDLADWIDSQVKAGNINKTQPIHLIGHSAGGFVMGECATVLKSRNVGVSQVTMLDTPFPYRHHFEQYPNPGSVERYITYLGGCRLKPPLLNFAPDLETCFLPGLPLLYKVRPGPYYYRRDVPGILHLHAYAHDWYTANTIQGSSQDGFYYSPFLNHAFPSTSSASLASQSRTKQSESVQTNADTILTGFETFGDVQVSNGVYRIIEEVNAGIFKDVALPVGAQYVKFRYRFVSPGDGDFLSVHWGTNAPLYIGPDLPFTREDFAEAQVSVADFAGQTDQLVFKLVARGATNAVLLLDQIRLEISSDPDHDGLTTEQEQFLGTNPLLADSDNDGISDGDEANLYHTNPLNRDTDGDGISDGEEILAGTSPTDRASVLQITSVGMDLNRNLALGWAGATNRHYRVNRSESLSRENYSTLTNRVPGIQPLNTFTDSGATNGGFFYWLEVEIESLP